MPLVPALGLSPSKPRLMLLESMTSLAPGLASSTALLEVLKLVATLTLEGALLGPAFFLLYRAISSELEGAEERLWADLALSGRMLVTLLPGRTLLL